GVREIRVFGDLPAARTAAAVFDGPADGRLLCGEENCLRPAGFDLGNSPGAFDPAACAGRVAFMSTTNGTRAILAARGAGTVRTCRGCWPRPTAGGTCWPPGWGWTSITPPGSTPWTPSAS